MSDNRISQAEMREMFGEEMPVEAIKLLWDAPPEKTLRELRDDLRKLAKPTPTTGGDELMERLSGPHEWGYRCIADGTFIADDAPFQAAARIQADAATIAGMREALDGLISAVDAVNDGQTIVDPHSLEAARAALKGGDHG